MEHTKPDSFSQENLKYYYDRCLAIILPPGHKGTYLIIVMRNSKTGQYSYITIQVKNKQKYDLNRYIAAGFALSPKQYFEEPSINSDYIGIYIEVDYKKSQDQLKLKSLKKHHRKYPRHMMLLGTPQVFLLEDLSDTFKFIQQNSKSNVDSGIRTEILNRMNTVTYKFTDRFCCKCTIISCSNDRCGCRKHSLNCIPTCHQGKP